MPSLPNKLAHGDSLKELVPTINALIECVRAITPHPSPTTRVRTLPSGTVLVARGPARVSSVRRTASAVPRWNGKAYDFHGWPVYEWEDDEDAKDQDGNWIVGGTHLVLTPSVDDTTGLVTFSAAMETNPNLDRAALFFKVADAVTSGNDTLYRLTDDVCGAIRLPFLVTGAYKFQVYSFGANGLPGFGWVRAHVGQEPQQQSGGGEGEGGGG